MIIRTSLWLFAAIALFCCLGDSAPNGVAVSAKRANSLKFPFGRKKVHGVSLGGWLILEPWINPSLFASLDDTVRDEWTMGNALGAKAFEKVLQKHWSTWITEADFIEIADLGLNFVRINIGYWSVIDSPGTPYVSGANTYLKKAVGWAQKHGLMVMIDLHGAPGSQNGYDNSGHYGSINWTQGDTVQQTYKTLNKLRDEYASHPAVATIELLNEPIGKDIGISKVTDFYTKGYKDMVGHGLAVTVQAAYEGINAWNVWAKGKKDVIVDIHPYQIFRPHFLGFSLERHKHHARKLSRQMRNNTNSWTIAGEITGATTDCAYWLNGRGNGARYDATYTGFTTKYGSCEGLEVGSVQKMSAEQKKNVGEFSKAQFTAYDKADGWIFWTWITETAPEWHFKNLTATGVIDKSWWK